MSQIYILKDAESIWTNGAMSNTTIHSSAVNMQLVNAAAIQAVWSAGSTPVGVLSVEYSNDGTNFDNDDGSNTAVSGNTGHTSFILPIGMKFARLAYVGTSGTGTINATVNAQGWK